MIPTRHGDSIRLISVSCMSVCVRAIGINRYYIVDDTRFVVCCACTNLHDFFSDATASASGSTSAGAAAAVTTAIVSG